MTGIVKCSPRHGSISDSLADMLNSHISGSEVFSLKGDIPRESDISALLSCKKLIFLFPLYVDGPPSHLLRWMEAIARMNVCSRPAVYCICVCGFYEGRHTRVALDIMKNFCRRCGFVYGGGMGIGSAGMVPFLLKSPGIFPPASGLRDRLHFFLTSVMKGRSFDNIYTTAGISRRIYKSAAETSFRVTAGKNGVRLRRPGILIP